MDLLQAAHTWSGIEMALWDLLGQGARAGLRLLGYDKAYPKLPYASQLFGDTPAETLAGCRAARDKAFAPPSAAGARSAAARLKATGINCTPPAKDWARTASC